jgi:hypothetical protein
MTPETLDRVPEYPTARTSRADGEKYLLWRLNLGMVAPLAAFSMAGGVTEYIRQTITVHHGESRIMGKNPAGKVETLGALFERVTGQKLERKAKRMKA